MVFDTLDNYKKYISLHKNFFLAFEFLEAFILNPKPVGRYEILGEKVFALVQEYEPKLEGKLESHKDYIDIQFVASGSEKMEVGDVKKCKVKEDLTPEKDLIFYDDILDFNTLILNENDFAIFFPSDAHKPALKHNSNIVSKIVIKVSVN